MCIRDRADADPFAFETVLQTFAAQSADAETVLFYYAGHAFQAGGVNRLVPVSARLDSAAALTSETLEPVSYTHLDVYKRQAGVRAVLTSVCDMRQATPYLFEVSGDDWLANHALGEEVFGPLGLIVRVRDFAQMQAIASQLEGQLTCTLHVDPADYLQARSLLPVLERKAGRVLANGCLLYTSRCV